MVKGFNFSIYFSPCLTLTFILFVYFITSSHALKLANCRFKQEKQNVSRHSFLQDPSNEGMHDSRASHTLEEVYNKALGTRQRVVGTINSAIQIFSTLLYDSHLLQEQKIMRLQRIEQLTYQLVPKPRSRNKRIADLFIENKEHFNTFHNRWVQYLSVPFNIPQPSWTCKLFKNNKKEQHSITQENKFVISEKEEKPTSILLSISRHFTIGFISGHVDFPDIGDTKSGCAGFIFKFQNEKNYGFLTLCATSSSHTTTIATSDLRVIFGRMNQGVYGILKTEDIKRTLTKKFMHVLLEFSQTTARVYLDKEIVATFRFMTPWVDGGSVGLHSASSSVNFDNIISGPYRFSEFEKEIIPLDEDDTIEKHVKTHEWSAEEYQMFLSQANLHSHEGVKHTNETLTKEHLHENDKTCYDFRKSRFDINDWNVSQTSSWRLIDGPNPNINRFISEASFNSENDDSLLLKTMQCSQASISVNIWMGPESAAGITFHYVDPMNRWMCTLDNGFGLLKLIHIDQGDPKIVGLVSVPTLNAFQTQFLELRDSGDTNRVVYEIWLNNKRLILHSFDLNQINETSVEKVDSLGLVIGKGTAEFYNFSVFNVNN